jgi:hypothetical protein
MPDFIFFKQVLDLISLQKHVTLEGLQQILNIKASSSRIKDYQIYSKQPFQILVQYQDW